MKYSLETAAKDAQAAENWAREFSTSLVRTLCLISYMCITPFLGALVGGMR
jgi:hypothetical protein